MPAETRCEACDVYVPLTSVEDVTELCVWPITRACTACVESLESEPVQVGPECSECRGFCWKCLG